MGFSTRNAAVRGEEASADEGREKIAADHGIAPVHGMKIYFVK